MSQTIYDTTPMRQVFKEGTWDVKLSFSGNGIGKLGQQTVHQGVALPPL